MKKENASQPSQGETPKRSGFKAPLKFGASSITLVVCLGSEYLKIGHGRYSQGGVRVENLLVEKIEKRNDAEIAQILASYCKGKKIKPAQVLFVLPSKQFIFKNVDIPSTEKEEVSKIIDLQAGRFTPYLREEIVIDFLCLDTLTQHFTSVLLFIVNRKIADRYASIFEMARVEVDKVIVASECMAMSYDNAIQGTPLQGALGGLHIGEEYSELTVLDNHQIVFVRSIPVGASAFKKNQEQARIDFVTELDKSINAYHDQGVGKPIHMLFATGLVESIQNLDADIKKMSSPQTNTIEFSVFDYRKLFSVSEPVMTVMNQANYLSFFEIFSVLSYAHQAKINILLPEVKLQRRVREGSKEALGMGILIMLIFLLLSLIMGSRIYFKKVMNQKLEKLDHSYGEEAKKLETISTKNRIVKKLLDNRGKELQILNVINGFIGDDLYLSQINYDNEGNVTIAGTAASMSRVFAFVTQLKESNRFSKVETKETKSRKEGKQDVADFLIECVLAQGFLL
ncbi:MAG TPA: pilus assembly protein PilM [Candidatus Omnitrophota bacterium]|nr:pilus assembly protein PilM [Candidatus Omnitrophota bacterium]